MKREPRRSASAVNKPGITLVSLSHVVDDLYQGVVPAMLPFLVAERHYSYAAISGITLAATVLSSVAQPVFGIWVDKRSRPWMIGGGLLVAGLGVSLAGLASSYLVTWILVAISGLGVAAFHPEAARAARQSAGNSNTAMSVFALGGNVGYALGTAITTPVLLMAGLQGMPLLALPAIVMALLLARYLQPVLRGRDGARKTPTMPSGADNWPAFLTLTTIVIIRSILFFGFASFIALYFIDHLGTSKTVGGAALTTFLTAGALGTLLGGWLGDRFNPLASIRIGFTLAIPALAGVVWFDSTPTLFVFVALLGIASFLPFSVFVLLGQNYLPNRIGTASGVTVGLGVSIGGLANPLLGLLADHSGLRTTLTVLLVLPLAALVVTAFLKLPVEADVTIEGDSSGPTEQGLVDEPGGDS